MGPSGVLCRNLGSQRSARGPGLAGPMSPCCPSSPPPSHPSLGTVTQARHPLPHSAFQGQSCLLPGSQTHRTAQGGRAWRMVLISHSRETEAWALSNLPRSYLLRSGRAVAGSWGCGLLSPVLIGSTRTPSIALLPWSLSITAPLSVSSPLLLLSVFWS